MHFSTDLTPNLDSAANEHEIFLLSLYATRLCVCCVLLFLVRGGRACKLKKSAFSRIDHLWVFAEAALCADPTWLFMRAEHNHGTRLLMALLNFAPVPVFLVAVETSRAKTMACCVAFALMERSALAMVVGGVYAPLFLMSCRPLWVAADVFANKVKEKKNNLYIV